ncbi:hypothetical protein WJX82_002058 [Trebouxia sp. C0006]
MVQKYAGEDALAYQEGPADPAGPVNYVQKRLQKRKGVEVVFDPKGQKDFLTGFRQRKQKRRKEAAKQIEKKERQAKLQERAERRQALREKLNLDQFDSDPDAPDTSRQAPCKDAAKPSQVSIRNFGDYTSVVTVEPFGLNEDSESARASGSSSAEEDDADQEGDRAVIKMQPSARSQAQLAPQAKKLKPSAIYRKKKKHAGANGKKSKKKREKL